MVARCIDTDALWQVLESVPDPEIPVVSVVDLGIVRDVRAGPGDDHPDLYRLPGHPGDRARHPRRARRGRLPRRRDRDRALAALDDRLDQRERQGEAPRLWHRAAEHGARPRPARNAARPTPRRSAASARRRARRSGAAAPASSRSTCSSATDERRLPHPDDRRGRRRDGRGRARSASTCREELRETFKFKPGQHLTLKAEIGGEEVRRNYSLCVAPQDGAGDGHRQADRRRRLLQLGERQSEARRWRSR